MKTSTMKTKTTLVLLTLGILACNKSPQNDSRVDRLPYYRDANFTPHWFEKGDARLDTFHRISLFSLVNQEGKTVTEKTFEDKLYVVDFFFSTCPGICPKMTTNMMMLQEEFINDHEVLLMSHTVTPETDSVPVLKQHAKNKGILSHKWHLVTGSQEDIYKLGRQDYFVEESLGVDKDDDEFLHTENFVLIDKDRHIRGIYNGLNKTSITQLIADIKTLKEE